MNAVRRLSCFFALLALAGGPVRADDAGSIYVDGGTPAAIVVPVPAPPPAPPPAPAPPAAALNPQLPLGPSDAEVQAACVTCGARLTQPWWKSAAGILSTIAIVAGAGVQLGTQIYASVSR